MVTPRITYDSKLYESVPAPITMASPSTIDGPERKPTTDETPKPTARLLAEQRNDIDRILLLINDLKHDMASVKEAMAEAKSAEPAESRNPHRRSAFPEELELLTENVSRLNSRVGDIDGLRLEMIVMKRRVKVLEQGYPSQMSHTVTGHTPSATSRPIQPEPRVSVLATRPAHRPLYPNGPPQAPEAGSPMVASSVESRTASTDLYGVSPEYEARHTMTNGDQDMRDTSSANATSSIASSTASSLDSQSDPSSSLEPQLQQPPLEPQLRYPPPISRDAPVSIHKNTKEHEMVRVSDPEDSDYDPDSQGPRTRNHPRGTKIRLPTPDWERPSWTGPPNSTNNPYGRPLGGPEPDPKRRKTYAEGLDPYAAGLPNSWTESSYHTQSQTQTPSQTQPPIAAPTPTENSTATYVPSPISPSHPPSAAAVPTKQDLRSVPRARDAQGRLLRPDGKIDGRSIRYGHPPKLSTGRRASAGDALKGGWATANDPAHIPHQAIQSPLEPPPHNNDLGPRDLSNNIPSPTVSIHDPPPQQQSATPPVVAANAFSPPQQVEAAGSPALKVEGGASAASPGRAAAGVMLSRAARKARYEKERDDAGNLLARNGRVDGRSLRYKKMKEEREDAAAQLEGAT